MENISFNESSRDIEEMSMDESVKQHIMSVFTSPDFIRVLADKIKEDIIPNTASPALNVSTSQGSDISVLSDAVRAKQVQLPSFSIPTIDPEDKLKGHGNFRSWRQRIERDLIALGRFEFLQHPLGGEACNFTHEEKRMYDAQVRQYLEATLQSGPRTLISNESTAAEAFLKIEQMFGKNDVQKMVELLDNFGKIILHPKMNPMAFITRFENAVQQFRELGVPLDQKIVVAYFLHKVRHIRPFMGFYTTIATLPEATRTYEFVRNTFLDVASSQYALEMENSKYNKNDIVNNICSACIDDSVSSSSIANCDIVTICAICLHSSGENEPTKDLSVSVSCIKCGKGSINVCDFCTGSRGEGSSSEPPKKKEKLSSTSKIFLKKSTSPYTSEQVEKIKKMSPEEKKLARCNKCGLLFHKSSECKNDGRVCFYCFKKGHEKKDCRKLQSLKSKS